MNNNEIPAAEDRAAIDKRFDDAVYLLLSMEDDSDLYTLWKNALDRIEELYEEVEQAQDELRRIGEQRG